MPDLYRYSTGYFLSNSTVVLNPLSFYRYCLESLITVTVTLLSKVHGNRTLKNRHLGIQTGNLIS